MLSEDVGQVLSDYFAWATSANPADLLFPHVEIVRRMLGGGIGCEGLSDDEALLVNFALCRLREERPDVYAVIRRIYAERKTARWMADRGEGDRNTINRLAAEGREFVRGVIFGSSYHAEKSGCATP